MKTSCPVVAVAVLSVALGGGAAYASQDAQSKIPAAQREAATATDDAKTATITGCVAQGATPSTYTLTNATNAAAAKGKELSPRASIVLSGTDVDLTAHVGHKVAVTGAFSGVDMATGAVGTAGTAAPAAAAAREGDAKPSGTLMVKSVKMVADSCAEAAK
jgi:hypothetical protein